MTNNENVFLKIYDLTNANDYLYDIGLGIFHTSVKVYNREYNFGSIQGIYHSNKKCLLPLRERIYLGITNKSIEEIEDIVKNLEHDFCSKRYHPTYNNCNDFAISFCDLILNKSYTNVLVPKYVNRLPKFCTCMGCLIPKFLDCDTKANNLIYEEEKSPLIEEEKKPFSPKKRKNSFDEVINGYEMV